MSLDLVERQRHLLDHVRLYAGATFAWGRNDCACWPALWVRRMRGIDLDLVAYDSETEARRLIADAGGVLPLWQNALSRADLYETMAPQYGDVGLVTVGKRLLGAILMHDGICALRTEVGVTMLRPRGETHFWAL